MYIFAMHLMVYRLPSDKSFQPHYNALFSLVLTVSITQTWDCNLAGQHIPALPATILLLLHWIENTLSCLWISCKLEKHYSINVPISVAHLIMLLDVNCKNKKTKHTLIKSWWVPTVLPSPTVTFEWTAKKWWLSWCMHWKRSLWS